MEEAGYQKGEFCAYIRCVNYPNLMIGKKAACQRCMAYKFHDYIQKNFKSLQRKKPDQKR